MLAAGTRLGPYEIIAALGAGGMGEVYRARDTKLNRDVAIKVLPDLFAQDPERLARFTREAQTLAALNHPHIAQVYGREANALVMELVDGDDLSSIIARGPIPLAEALAIARQISDALEAAHEQGIVHRDLKPANVMVRPDGTVKVLDFGLAKVLAPEGAMASGGAMNAPTLTRNATELGVILGTAAYMAPEQARGKPVDRRADIWAFGCVLYELVTGRRAFDGEDTADVLARLIEREPDWNALSAKTPADVRWLLMRCLTKDAKGRLRDIGEARVTLDEVLARGSSAAIAVTLQAGAPPRASWRRALPWGLAIVLGTIAVLPNFRAPDARRPGPIHVEINLPADVEFFSGPSLSADGRTLAFVGGRLGTRQIYTRSLDEMAVRPVAGTDTAVSVALSPDGAAAAFVTNDTRLKRVVLANGVVESLADGASIYSGPAWAGESIVFSRGASLALRSRDGAERELAKIDAAAGEVSLSWPTPVAANYSLTSDGHEFLMVQEEAGGRYLNLVLDWLPGLGRQQ
jgi:predicted Ser/Thr protein kinase